MNNQDDKLLFTPVKTDANKVGILIGIYANGYDTTAGITKTIEESFEKCLFLKEYCLYLPVCWYKQNWLFPDNKIGKLKVDYDDEEHPYVRVEDDTHWDYVQET